MMRLTIRTLVLGLLLPLLMILQAIAAEPAAEKSAGDYRWELVSSSAAFAPRDGAGDGRETASGCIRLRFRAHRQMD